MKVKEFIKKYDGDDFNCVYRLISSKGVVVYVGSTSYPVNRIRSHVGSDREFDSVEIDVIDKYCGMRDEESRQIVKYNPMYNIAVNFPQEFPKLKHANSDVCGEIKSLVSDLPCVFSRGRDKYVSAKDLKKLKADILNAAIQSLKEIHKATEAT